MDYSKADPDVLCACPLPTPHSPAPGLLLTELVPRICRLGFSDSSSLATILRKLSTKRLMLWQWQAMSNWSSASMAMHTYLGGATASLGLMPVPPSLHDWDNQHSDHLASIWVMRLFQQAASVRTAIPTSVHSSPAPRISRNQHWKGAWRPALPSYSFYR